MSCTEQARRVQKARRIIRRAYRIDLDKLPIASRFELIGEEVAALVLVADTMPPTTQVLVAREYPSGYTKRLRAESRDDIRSPMEVVAHFERLYSRYR